MWVTNKRETKEENEQHCTIGTLDGNTRVTQNFTNLSYITHVPIYYLTREHITGKAFRVFLY